MRGHREHSSAFDRIENQVTPYAEVSVFKNTITLELSPPEGARGATAVDAMLWDRSLPRIEFAPPLRRFKYVDVEADRAAVEAWIRENALPAGWISAGEESEKVRFPAGRKPKADWDALEDALGLRIDEIGFPTPDHHDKKWRGREDVIRWAQDFLGDRKERVARNTVAGRIDEMLERLKSGHEEPEI